jgi:hypothetical protein
LRGFALLLSGDPRHQLLERAIPRIAYSGQRLKPRKCAVWIPQIGGHRWAEAEGYLQTMSFGDAPPLSCFFNCDLNHRGESNTTTERPAKRHFFWLSVNPATIDIDGIIISLRRIMLTVFTLRRKFSRGSFGEARSGAQGAAAKRLNSRTRAQPNHS